MADDKKKKSQAEEDVPEGSSEEDASEPEVKQRSRKPKNKSEGGEKKRRRKPSGGGSSHPSTLDMVLEAMENLNEPKGLSVQCIKNYILEEYKMDRPIMLKHMLRTAFSKGLKQNILERPAPRGEFEKPLHLLSGRYKLVTAPKSKQTKRQSDMAASVARPKKKKKPRRR